MLAYASYVGRRQGPRFVAFYGCMFYAMMRPAEVISLTRDGCRLPETGWGRLMFSDSSPAAGREFTDDGRVHEDRGLKGRDRQTRARTRTARARRATRNVPIPPELVTLLREHIAQFGTGPAGACSAARGATRSAIDLLAGLAKGARNGPYPRASRHSPDAQAPRPASLWSYLAAESTVPATEVAAWAGHSVEC